MWTLADIPPQTGRRAIVTGTGGLGYQSALTLAAAGATVILAGRSETKGRGSVVRSSTCIRMRASCSNASIWPVSPASRLAGQMEAVREPIDCWSTTPA